MKKIIAAFGEKDIPVVLIRDVPMLADDPTNIKSCQLRERLFRVNTCIIKISQDRRTRSIQDNIYDKLLLDYGKAGGVRIYDFDPIPFFENQDGYFSYKKSDGEVIFTDQHHISDKFSKSLSEGFREFLKYKKLI